MRATSLAHPALGCLGVLAWAVLTVAGCRPAVVRQQSELELRVTEDVVGRMSEGIGWNSIITLEERWPPHFTGHDFTPQDWDRYFDLLQWSGCHWVRCGVNMADWEPDNDDDDPHHLNPDGFAFNSERMQRNYLVFDHLEKRGIDFVVAEWGGRCEWLRAAAEPGEHHGGHSGPDPREEFVESLAALAQHLKRVKKYTHFRSLSLWNEPNLSWPGDSTTASYPEDFWPLYGRLDRRLVNLGLRSEIRLFGPDTSTSGASAHILRMLRRFGPVLDVIADHDYEDYFDYDGHGGQGRGMAVGVEAYGRLVRELETISARPLPVVISEFGNYGARAGAVDDDAAVYDGAISTAELVVRLLNVGVAGFARWSFEAYGDRWRNFGALTATDPACVFRPYGPVYYPHAVLARYVKPQWIVMRTAITGGRDAHGTPRVWAAALRSHAGEFTILVINDAFEGKELRVEAAHRSRVLHWLYVEGPIPTGLRRGGDVRLENGTGRVMLEPRSINALTTMDPGDLTLPQRRSLCPQRGKKP